LKRKHDIRDILESVVVTKLGKFDVSSAIALLYYFGKERIGEKVLIDSLIQRLEKEAKKEESALRSLPAVTCVEAVLSLNLVGADGRIAYKYAKSLLDRLDEL
jgi:uncharacterized membrane-anchored protein YjiN (DUF445 family)